MAVGLPLLLGLIHVALVAPHYYVGSFDDDASYILAARALLSGQGLTGHLASGQVVVGLYPPGYPALLAPLLWIWPHSFVPLRLLSVVCYAAVFPLTWIYLRRRQVGEGIRIATLGIIALGPPFATFGSMVMAEAPFLVVLLLLLLAADRWQAQVRVFTWAGAATVVAAAGAIWLKQAGIALVGGLVLWLLFRRWRQAVALAAGVGLSLVPVVVARLASGIPLAGSRYSMELGGYYQGGMLGRLHHVLPGSTGHLFSTAIPATIVPYLEPLPLSGHWPDLWKVISWHVSILALVGAIRWWRRYRDATAAMVALYLLESVLWPYVNERRAILILPLLVAWYVMGAVAVWETLLRLTRRAAGATARPSWPLTTPRVGALLVAAFLVVPLAAQMPRDYLYGFGQSGSRFQGSRYMALLRHLGSPADVVETDYQSSTALFSGHATNWTAFMDTPWGLCYLPAILGAIHSDRAGFLLLGDVNKPGVIDDECLAQATQEGDWAVQLLHTRRDNATVFELIGPGTGHPGLGNVLAGIGPSLVTAGAVSTAEWDFAGARLVSQVSLGDAAAPVGVTSSVQVQLHQRGGGWVTIATADRPVGDERGAAPYLLAELARPVDATAMRVVVTGQNPGFPGGQATDASGFIADASVLGPAAPVAAGP